MVRNEGEDQQRKGEDQDVGWLEEVGEEYLGEDHDGFVLWGGSAVLFVGVCCRWGVWVSGGWWGLVGESWGLACELRGVV